MPRKAKRDPRGGPRAGQVGRAYSNRSDMNPAVAIQATRGGTYGDRQAQITAQQAVPMARAGGTGPAPAPGQGGAGGPSLPPPGSLGNLLAPTTRPDEPLTAGMPSGPGPGPDALPMLGPSDDTELRLRALYRMYPNDDLRELIEDYDVGATF